MGYFTPPNFKMLLLPRPDQVFWFYEAPSMRNMCCFFTTVFHKRFKKITKKKGKKKEFNSPTQQRQMDLIAKNEIKSKYYKLFHGKVEASVIDMVLEGCHYDESDTRVQLVKMCGEDPLDAVEVTRQIPSAPTSTAVDRPPPYTTVDPNLQSFVPRDLYSMSAERQHQHPEDIPVLLSPSLPKYPFLVPSIKPSTLKPASTTERDLERCRQDDGMDLTLKLLLSLQLLRLIDEVEEDSKRATMKQQQETQEKATALTKHEYPKHWPKNNHGVTIIPVKKDVYSYIEMLFLTTSTARKFKVKIQSIEELCNLNTYEDFIMARYCMQASQHEIDEKELWYAPPVKDVENICYQSFDVEKRTHGPYGKGKYFYSNASMAHKNRSEPVNDTGFMFLANIIVGRFTKGSREMDYIPLDEEGNEYNTCVDDELRPSVFVKFEKSQCYPRFLITYKVIDD